LYDFGSKNASSIQKYAAEKGGFETAGFRQGGQVAGVDFPIVAGEGYFIFIRGLLSLYALGSDGLCVLGGTLLRLDYQMVLIEGSL